MRRISILVLNILCAFCFLGCEKQEEIKNEKITVASTIYPINDWVNNLVNNSNMQTEVLLTKGSDLHNFQPTAEDIVKIINSDLFIYVGGESDEWVEDVLKNANDNINSLNLLEVLKDQVKIEEHIEGMQEEEHEHDHEDEEYDEHVWLSLRNAEIVCEAISEKLIELSSDNSQIIKTNTENYLNKLKQLDEEYESVVSNSNRDTVLIADRFPFRYLFDDYGIKYYAAFSGCSAESEASFETIAFLSNKTDELNLNHVLCLEDGNNKIAKAVIDNSSNGDREILILNSMQSIMKDNESYLSIMKDNLDVLKEVLN